jgi:hypothetical protein
MNFIGRRTRQRTTDGCYYVCTEGKHEYRVLEYGSPSGPYNYRTFVYFERTTSNVFGNGSTDVWQSGWRSLPSGPKRRRLVEWFKLRKQRNELVKV